MKRTGEPLRKQRALLLSFCNVWPPGHSTALVDPKTGNFTWVGASVDARDTPVFNGTDGLCYGPTGVYGLEQVYGADHVWLTSYDARLLPTRRIRLPGTSDGHDLCSTPQGLALACSGRDRVLLVNPSTGDHRPLWSASEREADTNHINSVSLFEGDVFATAFGPKPADGWRHAADGFVVNCRTGEKIYSGIAHPHSLVSSGKSLWWCESATSSVWRWRNGRARRVYTLKGYLRGLAVTPHKIYVAASARRTRSRHLGTTIPVPNASLHVDSSMLFTINRLTGKVASISLDHIGSEVFAILPVCGEFPALNEIATVRAMTLRFNQAALVAAPVTTPLVQPDSQV